MKESKLTKKELKRFEHEGAIILQPICINCAFKAIEEMTSMYPDVHICLNGQYGIYNLMFFNDLFYEEE